MQESTLTRTGKIKEVLDRNARALELRPAIGQGSATTRARLTDGLRCEVAEGPWKLVADMSEKSGGTGAGPNPGVWGRASLASCLVIVYAMFAARRGILLDSLEVEVQADYDTRHEYGIGGPSPGYRQVRCIVNVKSGAPPEQIRRMIEDANSASSYLHVWQDPQDVRLDIRLNAAE